MAKKRADARKNASMSGMCGSAGDVCGGGGKSPGIGGGSKNVHPPYAKNHSSFSGVGGKSKSKD